MFAGFDYGTSNCAMGVIKDKKVRLLALDQGQQFMPSTLYAIARELICESVAQPITGSEQQRYLEQRQGPLARARKVRNELELYPQEQTLFIGQEAIEQYLSLPEEGYFVKSPKSFLGASGLRVEFVHFFEDLVTAMMQGIKQRAELAAGHAIEQVVIGRPVNFQGTNTEQSNQQALTILTVAAHRAGFKAVEFLFEPIAAGLAFEENLSSDKTVLVVDVGGGTTDCAMVRMGPSHRHKLDRADDFIGHSGERVGGNDLDIQLAGNCLMPLFGMRSLLKNGLPMPSSIFWDAVSTNNVAAQADFNSQDTSLRLQRLLLDTQEPVLLNRFIKLRAQKQHHYIVRLAEQAKIALSDQGGVQVDLSEIEHELVSDISTEQLADAIERPLSRMVALMEEAVIQADCSPELIYVTGGSVKSPIIRRRIEQRFTGVEVLDGDHFGSVASGLTVWAQRLFA